MAIVVALFFSAIGEVLADDVALYLDRKLGFSIAYPTGFVVSAQDPSRFGAFTPTPIAAIYFMNPTMARSAFAGVEPPDLEVRLYEAGTAGSLAEWLQSTRLASADSIALAQPYHSADVNSLRICRSPMIAPACSVFVLHRGRVYQLTAISIEGETMIKTFALLP